jgi:hypothetical protein
MISAEVDAAAAVLPCSTIMNVPHTKDTTAPALPVKEPGNAVDFVSLTKMHQLLTQAAQVAASAGLPPESFASLAWQAYLRASPELAERLAEAQFDAALEELRNSGRLAKA